jgi:hypothetical protein
VVSPRSGAEAGWARAIVAPPHTAAPTAPSSIQASLFPGFGVRALVVKTSSSGRCRVPPIAGGA